MDDAAVRNTQDVDILIRRPDLDAVKAALEKAGVPVTLFDFPGLVHGFVGLGALSPGSATATEPRPTPIRHAEWRLGGRRSECKG